MIRESDVQWWLLEAEKHPESAPQIIGELAKRLIELDAENEQLRGEIIRLHQRGPSERPQAAITTLKRQVETLQKALQRQDTSASFLVLLSDSLQAARISLPQAQLLAEQDRPALGTRAALSLQRIVAAGPGDELLLITNQAYAYQQMAADIPQLDEKGRWPAAPQNVDLSDAARLAAVSASNPAPRLWTMVTRRGYVQRLVHAGMERDIANGQTLYAHLDRRDAPVALVSGDLGEIALITRWGQAIRFPQHTIETQGSLALDLDPDDQVVGAVSLPVGVSPAPDELLIVTASGYGIRRNVAQLPARSRPGDTAGKALIHARDVLGLFVARPGARLAFATYGGKLVFAPSERAPSHDRLAKGDQLCDLGHDPAVAVTLLP
jgi:DNA gyrase/topoisomerase IV subunit A